VAILYVVFSFYSIWPIIQTTLQFTILRCRLEACSLPFTASPSVTVLRHTQGVPTEECWYFRLKHLWHDTTQQPITANLTFRGPCIVIYSYNKSQHGALISQIYFWNRILHVSDSFSAHHQESSTVHTAIGICHRGYAGCLLASSQHNLYVLLCVQC
jgi:hypothetical protein